MTEKHYSTVRKYISNLVPASMLIATLGDDLKVTLPGGTPFLLRFGSIEECNEFWAKSIPKIGEIIHED